MKNITFYEPIKDLKMRGVSSISQMYGRNDNPLYKKLGMKGHSGIDLVKKKGAGIYSATQGSVMKVNFEGNAGIYIRIMSKESMLNDKRAMVETCYFHLLDIVVKPNQIVAGGQLIGHMDNTGFSTGTHLHFGIRPYWYKNMLWQSDRANGYNGYIDPYSYLLKAKKIMTSRIIKASEKSNKRWLVINEKYRFWILDPPTMIQGTEKIWGKEVEVENPERFEYGGAIFISKTDDPLGS